VPDCAAHLPLYSLSADVPTTKAIKQASLVSSAFEVAAYGVKLPIIDGRAANPRNSAA